MKDQMTGFSLAALPHTWIQKIHIDENGCWNWIGANTGKGHGKVSYKGRKLIAHRIIYKLLVDDKLDDSLHLDHLCRNRRCVNPHHLEPVSPAANTHRGNAVLFCTSVLARGDDA